MRYFFIFILSFLPLTFSWSQNTDDKVSKPRQSGIVTTRTGGTVVTRSYTGTYKKREPAVPAKGKILIGKKQKTSDGQEIIDPESIKGMFKQQADDYRKQAKKSQADGDLKTALVYYAKSLEIDPTNFETCNDIGIIYESAGDEVNAVKMYKKALEIKPDFLPAYSNLALLYEAKGDATKAIYYWQKRYEMAKPWDQWKRIAQEHLFELGVYPEEKKEALTEETADFSSELVYRKAEQRTEDIKEARLHYTMGMNFYLKKEYASALREFETALSLNPADPGLKEKTMNAYRKTQKAYTKDKVLTETRNAIGSINDEDFSTAEEKLKNALSNVNRVAQEK
jgi:Flp pilus assembly protein TadD